MRQEATGRQPGSLMARFRFDCFRKGEARWQWVHKEEREFHGDECDVRSYCMPVTPIAVDDFVEIAVPMMSLMGTTLAGSLEWHPL